VAGVADPGPAREDGARTEVLARVRAALRGVRRDAAPVPLPPTTTTGDLPALFAERVADYRATVVRCAEADLAAAVAAALPAGADVVVPAGLSVAVVGAREDDGLPTADLDRVGAVVTDARVAIATTGTVVLDHGPGQGRRALTLVPDCHVCVVRETQVVADVPEAIAALDPRRPTTWISGPSATSDIELDRVEGVHGPRQLTVVLVRPDPDPGGDR
jgi:L-lactate dehydrogenase complex protein LldG